MTKRIINLTQHKPTKEQIEAGVFDADEFWRERITKALTFDELPTADEIRRRAKELASIAYTHYADAAMIGGAPYLMAPLEEELRKLRITPLYAFSRRVSIEEQQRDGSVVKKQIFRHEGFVEGAGGRE